MDRPTCHARIAPMLEICGNECELRTDSWLTVGTAQQGTHLLQIGILCRLKDPKPDVRLLAVARFPVDRRRGTFAAVSVIRHTYGVGHDGSRARAYAHGHVRSRFQSFVTGLLLYTYRHVPYTWARVRRTTPIKCYLNFTLNIHAPWLRALRLSLAGIPVPLPRLHVS